MEWNICFLSDYFFTVWNGIFSLFACTKYFFNAFFSHVSIPDTQYRKILEAVELRKPNYYF